MTRFVAVESSEISSSQCSEGQNLVSNVRSVDFDIMNDKEQIEQHLS